MNQQGFGFGEKAPPEMIRTAEMSECGVYRYRLSRVWEPDRGKMLFVMLNPSIADAEYDDPTIRKCVGFSKRWGYGGFDVVNLFAYRATKPAALKIAARNGVDVVGPDNDAVLDRMLRMRAGGTVVVAWGGSGGRLALERGRRVTAMIRDSAAEAYCLGKTTGRVPHPCHPVMLGYATPMEKW